MTSPTSYYDGIRREAAAAGRAASATLTGPGCGVWQRLDHGLLNVPLSKRGNIDAQIDRYKADEARKAVKEAQARFHDTRSKRARVAEILRQMPDERVLSLAKPLGARKAHTARIALARAASYNLDRWLSALEREVA